MPQLCPPVPASARRDLVDFRGGHHPLFYLQEGYATGTGRGDASKWIWILEGAVAFRVRFTQPNASYAERCGQTDLPLANDGKGTTRMFRPGRGPTSKKCGWVEARLPATSTTTAPGPPHQSHRGDFSWRRYFPDFMNSRSPSRRISSAAPEIP